MENASKALLIAAAVLIVILLIAFGMSVINSTGDATDKGKEVGEMIGTETNSASKAAMEAMGYTWDEATQEWKK